MINKYYNAYYGIKAKSMNNLTCNSVKTEAELSLKLGRILIKHLKRKMHPKSLKDTAA